MLTAAPRGGVGAALKVGRGSALGRRCSASTHVRGGACRAHRVPPLCWSTPSTPPPAAPPCL